MKIYIGYDHRGARLSASIMEYLVEKGYEVNEPFDYEDGPVDYPVVAKEVCNAVLKDKGSKAILICGTGIGMGLAPNRFNKIRSVLCHSPAEAYFARRHEDANILALAAGYSDGVYSIKTSEKKALEIVETFLQTEFEGDRHAKRVAFLDKLNDK